MLAKDTTLLYSIDHESNFTVTVVPINEVGPGEPKVYVKSTQIIPLHKDKISSVITTQETFSLGDKTNTITYLGIVSIIKLILLQHACIF